MSGWESVESCDPNLFQQVLTCLAFDTYRNPDLETGNKVVLPPTCLSRLTDIGTRFPWFFKIESFNSDKTSHCGVLEFCADEGFVYVPRWMMDNLGIREGEEVILRQARPIMGTRMKLQPHKAAFLEVADLRAVLEEALRGFACLSKGDTFGVREFLLDVVEVGPGDEVISLVDTDCEVEFATPLDYVEAEVAEEGVAGFRAFTGKGRRLGGKGKVADVVVAKEEEGKKREKEEEFKPFSGRGRVLGGPFFS
ncbi:ubiquitin fusion degradation protein 1 [Salvia divinorum]|uniref:Ubiquitin fusion degradation protein 1 n=1 Tax=Salvia divinorum TaxID=28513 RepID=A0ABD1HQL7_SALDI